MKKKSQNKNATTERIVKSVTLPVAHKLTEKEIFDSSGKPRIDRLKTHFILEGRLTDSAAMRILKEAGKMLHKLPNVLDLKSPLVIVGDIHGQFYDLMKLFEVGGSPDSNQYLFLGDYVDRGCFGIECVLYLFSIMIAKEKGFHLLRGNHECRHLTKYFSFKKECNIKYKPEVYEVCMEAFDCLPLAAHIDKKIFCIHGGLSPEIHTIDDIRDLDRYSEPPSHGPICDILWADPMEDYDVNQEDTHFAHNSNRGCSYSFSFEACSKFLKSNGLLSVIRAHEAQNDGFKMYKKCNKSKFPSLITIFSAPNYLDVYENKAAIMKYEDNKMNIKQFTSVPHPYWLPNFMNVFTWSLPFIAEKITQMLVAILNICSNEELQNDKEKGQELHKKIFSIAKVATAFSELREGNECILSMKGLTPSNTDPVGLSDKIKKIAFPKNHKIKDFDDAKNFDKINEMMPK